MKKVLWLIVGILAIASLSDQPFLLPYKQALFEQLSSEAENATKMQGSQSLRQVKKELTPIVQDMGDGQKAEVERITSDIAALRDFYNSYCVSQQFNPLFYGETMQKMCLVIDRQKMALDM